MLLIVGFNLISQNVDISGKIIDEVSDEQIEYATIVMYNALDSAYVDATVSDESGFFKLSTIKETEIYLSVQFMGYETYNSDRISLIDNIDLGVLRLSINQTILNEIEVTGKAVTSAHRLDKQIFKANQFQNARGGSASDILQNLPSVSVNSFGEISVRGATGFAVMINGKAIQGDITTFLQQYPANAIKDIEIITAPSAKYDPDGKAGIINIKTLESTVDGLFLNANLLAGLPSIEPYDNQRSAPRYGADINVNYKTGKWDLSAGLNYKRNDISGRREGYVNTLLDDILTEFPSDGERSFDEETYALRLAAVYKPSKNQTITTGLYAGKRTKERTADILYNQQSTSVASGEERSTEEYYDLFLGDNTLFQGGNQVSTLQYFNENLRVRKGDFLIGSLDYKISFDDESSLSLSGLYERTILGGPTDNLNTIPNTGTVLELQLNDNDNPLDGIRFGADYEKSVGGGTWQSGYQYRFLNHPGDFIYLDRDLVNDVWVENPLFTNSIRLKRSVHSLYTQFAAKRNKWEYSGGLRGEYFDRSVTIANPSNTFELKRFNLFPSFNLGYELQDDLLLKVGYSKRIQRTTTFKMTPFPEREHSETLEQGDAELLPEFIDLVELGIVKSWGDNSFFATTYYRHVDNLINRVNTVFNESILNRIYTNVGAADVVGLELGTTIYPSKPWMLFLGTNIHNYRIKGSLFDDPVNTSNIIYAINANTQYSFSPSFSTQLAFNYLSERVTAQGVDSRFYNPSLSIKKTFADKKYAFTLQWINMDLGLLNSNEQRITTNKSDFFTTTNYVYEVDIVQLNFTYQLNKIGKKTKLPKSEFGADEF